MAETARSQGDTGSAGDDRRAGGTQGGSPGSEHRDLSAPPLVVKRWWRYGHDRLYVAHPDVRKLGWWDLVTDEAHPASPQCLPILQDAVARCKTGQHPGNPTTAHPVEVVPGAAVMVQPVTPAQAAPSPDSSNLSALAAPSAADGAQVVSALAGTPAPAGEDPGAGGAGAARPCFRPSP